MKSVDNHSTMSEENAKPTGGAELEAHFIFLASFKKPSTSAQSNIATTETRVLAIEREAKPLFTLQGVTCATDLDNSKFSGQVRRVLRQEKALKALGATIPIQADLRQCKAVPSADIFEFSTDATDSLEEISAAFSRIKTIEKHLIQYILSQNHSGYHLINLAHWIEHFNRSHVNQPDLQIKLEDAGRDIFIVTSPSIAALQELGIKQENDNPDSLPHYPQFNFTASLEMLGSKELEKFLSSDIEVGLRKKGELLIQAAQKDLQDAIDRSKEGEEAAKFWEDIIPKREQRLEKVKTGYSVQLNAQRKNIESARETAKKTIETIKSTIEMPHTKDQAPTTAQSPKLKKLKGFFFLLSYYIATEGSKELFSSFESTPKNSYLFFVKHKISDILHNCLSMRDKNLLQHIADNAEAQKAILTELAGGEEKNLQKVMYSYEEKKSDAPSDSRQISVTVGDFLKSALGWTNTNVCDYLPTRGKLMPPLEPHGLHRKKQLSRIVLELRWPGEHLSLDRANELMLASMNQANDFCKTTRLEKIERDSNQYALGFFRTLPQGEAINNDINPKSDAPKQTKS